MHEFRQVFFPYCLDQHENGTWTLLNRQYKPLGFNTMDWIKYDSYPIFCKTRKIRLSTLQKISYQPIEEGETKIYLYNDGCVPTNGKKYMDAYLDRLRVLMSIQIKEWWE